jgi:peroxiredoxin Q/BCP
VRLSDFRGRRVVLYFYPKDDTKGCTAQACGFRDAYPTITEQNAVVIGISPDGSASHRKFKTKYDLPFILLTDKDHQVADRYGAWGEKKLYGRAYQGVLRSHFIIDEAGRIADAQVRVSPQDSVARALETLRA